jgi:hypothetical protein
MVVLLRSAVVIGVIGLISAQAWAECAWVQWSHSISPMPPETYRVDRAFVTRQDCVQRVHAFSALLKKEGYTLRAEGADEAIGQKGAETVTYLCLPDTIDPRGVKANR